MEWDEYENSSIHFVLYDEQNTPIGAGRLRKVDGYGKIERICILPEYRGRGAGKTLMEFVIRHAKTLGFEKIKLHSQDHAIGFYEKLGFMITSDRFYEAGIPHHVMELK